MGAGLDLNFQSGGKLDSCDLYHALKIHIPKYQMKLL